MAIVHEVWTGGVEPYYRGTLSEAARRLFESIARELPVVPGYEPPPGQWTWSDFVLWIERVPPVQPSDREQTIVHAAAGNGFQMALQLERLTGAQQELVRVRAASFPAAAPPATRTLAPADHDFEALYNVSLVRNWDVHTYTLETGGTSGNPCCRWAQLDGLVFPTEREARHYLGQIGTLHRSEEDAIIELNTRVCDFWDAGMATPPGMTYRHYKRGDGTDVQYTDRFLIRIKDDLGDCEHDFDMMDAAAVCKSGWRALLPSFRFYPAALPAFTRVMQGWNPPPATEEQPAPTWEDMQEPDLMSQEALDEAQLSVENRSAATRRAARRDRDDI
jgi:hypothetical protein